MSYFWWEMTDFPSHLSLNGRTCTHTGVSIFRSCWMCWITFCSCVLSWDVFQSASACGSAIILKYFLHVQSGLCCHAHLVQNHLGFSFFLYIFYLYLYSGQASYSRVIPFPVSIMLTKVLACPCPKFYSCGCRANTRDFKRCARTFCHVLWVWLDWKLLRVLVWLTGFPSEHTGHRCRRTDYDAPVIAMDIGLICLSEMSGLRDFG